MKVVVLEFSLICLNLYKPTINISSTANIHQIITLLLKFLGHPPGPVLTKTWVTVTQIFDIWVSTTELFRD